MGDLGRDYRALRDTAGAVWLPRDFVRVTGPDASSFLQGQLSQDLEAVTSGASALSLLLQPQGKVDALVRVTRTAEDDWLLDTDGGWGVHVLARLERFKLRVDVDLAAVDHRCLGLRGPGAGGIPVADDALVLTSDWPGLSGVDLVGQDPEVPAGVPLCASEAYEAVRVEVGLPVMGRELDERTIPAEAGQELVGRSVSFTKGCFTGQELVARIESRGGNVPRHLHGVVVEGESPPDGAAVRAGGRDVGALTSVAWSPGRAATVALAYVKRDVEPPADATVSWDGGEAVARIERLPLVS